MNSIKSNFVPYQIALDMKSIGFDEPCFGSYVKLTETQNTFFMNDVVSEIDRETPLHESLITKAPLYQQAFRWFREKYNIQGYIYSSAVRGNAEKTKQFTGYIWNINGIDMPFISTDARDELHDTYEEAELDCLKKLIEIVKDGK